RGPAARAFATELRRAPEASGHGEAPLVAATAAAASQQSAAATPPPPAAPAGEQRRNGPLILAAGTGIAGIVVLGLALAGSFWSSGKDDDSWLDNQPAPGITEEVAGARALGDEGDEGIVAPTADAAASAALCSGDRWKAFATGEPASPAFRNEAECTDFFSTATCPSPGIMLTAGIPASGGEVTLNWSPGCNMATYSVRLGTSPGATDLLVSAPTGGLALAATGLPAGQDVYYTLISSDGTPQNTWRQQGVLHPAP
ncbi:MAG: hypothetical protein ACM3S1_11835, partial [Hyphomicrobiales bacterium]